MNNELHVYAQSICPVYVNGYVICIFMPVSIEIAPLDEQRFHLKILTAVCTISSATVVYEHKIRIHPFKTSSIASKAITSTNLEIIHT